MSRLFIILISFLVLLVVGAFLIWPRYQELRSLQLEVAGKEVEVENAERHNLRIKELFQELEKYRDELLKIDYAVFPSPDFPSLFHFLQKSCSQNGLVLKDISPSFIPPQKKASEEESLQKRGLKLLQTEIEISGSYDAFLNFLSTLEKSARIIEVGSISFGAPEEGGIFSFKLSIRAYSY